MNRDEYVSELFQEDDTLIQVREEIKRAGMPEISVRPVLGKLLQMLVTTSRPSRVLEIGSLGGYSGICLSRGLPPEGKLLCLELNPEYAAFAGENLRRAGITADVEFKIGPALASLDALTNEDSRFDFFFIDADKQNYVRYLDYALELAHPGALICADNVLLHDRVLDDTSKDVSVTVMREFNRRIASDDRLEAVLLPIDDGFSIARVK